MEVDAYHSVSRTYSQKYMDTHESVSPEYRRSGFIGLPSLSNTGLISNTDRTDATVMKRELSLRCLPGHIRRPKPNAATEGSRVLGFI